MIPPVNVPRHHLRAILVLALAAGTVAGGVSPERGAASDKPASRWEEAFVTGNGRMGAMLFGNPTNDTLVANHCRLFLPLGSRELVPDLAGDLPELRRRIREDGYKDAMAFLLERAQAQGFPGLTPTDPLHPGLFVHIRQEPDGPVQDYQRTQDFRTGEVTAGWTDDRGTFRRRVFVSRTDNLIVVALEAPGSGNLSCHLGFPPPTPRERPNKDAGWRPNVDTGMIVCDRQIRADTVTFHNRYAMGKGGFDAAVRVVTTGGKAEAEAEGIRIAGADRALLVLRIVPWKTPMPKSRSEAWANSPDHPDFTNRLGRFDPNPPLADSSVVPFRKDEDATALMPQLLASLSSVKADYSTLFQPHAEAHAALFERVTLDLMGGADRVRSSTDLLAEARKTDRLPVALMEKMYDAGRYMYICSAGELPPNLQGIWTGSWIPAWSGDFTLDTNVQLAMKHAFSGNLGELMDGYFQMIEGFYPEWRLNAQRTYGCDGFMTNARASNTALLLHWGTWPGVFWTGGTGWLAHFFYDHWQYTGDEDFLQTRTVPLLKEVVAFYEDFVIVDPDTGVYEFVPSYSPESGTGISATMDVMVLKDALRSLVTACRTLGTDLDRIPHWETMLEALPAYRVNADGALAEWVPEGGTEHYKHRHLSHLHACYEALDDPALTGNPDIWEAAREATRRRIHAGGEVSSHGRMHMGLSAAYLGMAEEAYGRLKVMATGASMYDSLMCSHEPEQRIFNLDANGAIPEIVNRMLVRSHPGRLDLLPALPGAWPQGEIRGIRARRQITVTRLAWDVPARRLALTLVSDRDQTIHLSLPGTPGIRNIDVSTGKAAIEPGPTAGTHRAGLPARTPVTFDISW